MGHPRVQVESWRTETFRTVQQRTKEKILFSHAVSIANITKINNLLTFLLPEHPRGR